jgi:hypothetical protein
MLGDLVVALEQHGRAGAAGVQDREVAREDELERRLGLDREVPAKVRPNGETSESIAKSPAKTSG